MSIQFDHTSDKAMVHGRPDADGHHGHPKATYSFDAKTKAVTVKSELLGSGKAGTWTGTLDGEALTLSSADGNLRFKRGGAPHGH